ncbi:MAG: gliding motility-associated C-terminal domain-containing protein, partial [Bacteroidota bacterium]
PSDVCGDVSTEVFITVQPSPQAEAGTAETLTCNMGMVSLSGLASTGIGELSYAWTGPNGQTDVIIDPTNPMIDVSLPGFYTLTVTSELGCTSIDQVEVRAETEVPIPQIELSNISCFSSDDGAISVSSVIGGSPPYTFALNGGTPTTSTFFSGLLQGEYSLRVTDDNGCFSDLFLDVTEPEQLSISIDLQNDEQNYNLGDRVSLSARISGGNTIDTLIWEPDSLRTGGEGNTITFVATETQQIMVTVIDELGCTATDMTTIFVRRDDPVYIPTGISPNGDNVNDVLFINANMNQVDRVESFLVFNRWGEAVFQNYDFMPNDPVQGWNGTHRGETLNPAVFVYVAVVVMDDGRKVVYKGDITLVR